MKKFFTVLALGVLCLSGCGYTAGTALPSSWRTIYVAPFGNKIDYTAEDKRTLYVQLLEVKIRSGIINRFQFDGHLKIVEEDAASLVLTGELVDYSRGVLRYTDSNDVEEYRIQIAVNLKVTEGKDGPVVWQENGFTGEATYFVTGAQAKSEDTAVADAITDLSRRVVERTVESW